MSAARPPRIAGRVAALLLGRTEADRLLGDLDEEYVELQRPIRGRLRADVWYWRQVLGSAWALSVARGARPRDRGAGMGEGMVVESLTRDVRYALRSLVRAPAFAASAVVTLALGIGATTAIFSVVNAVLLRSLPYEEPERIVRAWDHTRDGDITDFSFRVVEYQEARTRTEVFEAVGAEFPISATVLREGQTPRQVQGRMVTPDFFEVFGVEPGLGRMFTGEEVAGGDRLLCVVSHGFWLRYLGGDPEAVGRPVDLNGSSFTVLGVLPRDYRHVSGSDAQVFIPYTIGTRGWIGHWLDMYARLQPEVTEERAAETFNAALEAVAPTDGRGNRWFATVEGLHEMVTGDVRTPVSALFGLVALVLLLACVNVANLRLARSTARVSEISVRISLGAGRIRLLRQLVVENLVLAAAGGALGVLLAHLSLSALVRLAPPSIPRIAEAAIDPVVLAFAFGVTATTTLVFGLGPAVWTTRAGPGVSGVAAGRRKTASRGLHRLLGGLVVCEVALTLTLLVAAGLTVRTLQNLQHSELGFDRSSALTFRVEVPASRYPTAVDTDAFYTGLREALAALPAVTAVGAATDLPVSGEGAVSTVTTEARTQTGDEGVTVLQRRATAGFFAALGTPLLAGREFDSHDRRDAPPVVIVSESLAQALFGEDEAVGRSIGWGSAPDDGDWMTVVGVVGDVRYENVERAPDPQVYQAHPQSTSREMALVVRTAGDPMQLLEPAEAAVHALDPQIPVYDAATLGGLVDVALSGRRFTVTLFGLFAAVALALTVAGLYGVLAFVVGQRRRELGIRIAVGATGAAITGLVLRRGLHLIGLGLALGTLGALAAGRLLRGLLYGVPSFDPPTLAAVGAVLACVGVAACLIPALGASTVDPSKVLRED